MITTSSCMFVGGERIRGNGNLVTQDRPVSGFSGVKSSGFFDVYVSSGTSQTVKIEAEENLQSYIETTMDGNILEIDTKEGYWLRPKKQVKIFITSPSFTSVRLSGSGNIISQNKIMGTETIDLALSGSGDIKVDVDAPSVKAEINGSGNMELKGQAKSFEGSVSGSGDIKAMDLRSEETKIRISGSGDANVYASMRLEVRVAGSGDVKYAGGVQSVSSNISGSGSVKKVD